jgi:hypothetical protein
MLLTALRVICLPTLAPRSFQHLYKMGSRHSSTRVSSSFLSSVPNGQHVRKSDTPGAGSYDPHDSSVRLHNSVSRDGSERSSATR